MRNQLLIIFIVFVLTCLAIKMSFAYDITSQPSEKLADSPILTGNITKPNNASFSVNPAAEQTNIATGAVTVVWGTEAWDQGGDFASNTFTAPVTGKYLLAVSVRLDNVDTAADSYQLTIVTSNRSYVVAMFDPDGLDSDPAFWNVQGSVVADMDATDTATVTITQTAGAVQTDIATTSYFTGSLLN